ncbi:hypothetical protein E2C01_077052 [Portunus trituberculatus]|uniref:Uncharacterized protein n=1 Tax=Portunus trituberculatus TaxID=210409 RepID=A0A5B7IL78_PORTR|nr:hypothetical protein [Portunus trituberculatus]
MDGRLERSSHSLGAVGSSRFTGHCAVMSGGTRSVFVCYSRVAERLYLVSHVFDFLPPPSCCVAVMTSGTATVR